MTPRHQEVAQLQQGEKIFSCPSSRYFLQAQKSSARQLSSLLQTIRHPSAHYQKPCQKKKRAATSAAVSNTRTSSLLLYTSLRRLLRRTRMTETIRAGSKRCRSRWRCRTLAFCRRVIALCRRGCRSRKCHRRRSWHCLQYRQIARRPRDQNSMNS